MTGTNALKAQVRYPQYSQAQIRSSYSWVYSRIFYEPIASSVRAEPVDRDAMNV